MSYSKHGGRHRIRVRETYVRDFVAPCITRGAAGVVKVDLLLRGIASPHGAEEAGTIPAAIRWEDIHEMVRPASYSADSPTHKRKWVSDKLEQLAAARLLSRELRPGERSRLVVLRDDRSGEKFDDPGAAGDSYVTLFGSVFEHGRIRDWGAPEIAAFVAAMVAERYARADESMMDALPMGELGGGFWFRPLDWFADEQNRRPAGHVKIPFSVRTLRRGFALLRQEGLVAAQRIYDDPRTGLPFKSERGRYLYRNGFDNLRPDRPRVRTYF